MKKILSVVLSILFAICLLGTLLLSVVRNNFSYSKLVKMAGEMMKPVSVAPVDDGLFHPGDIRYSLAAYEEYGDFGDFDLSSIDLSSIDLTNMDVNEIVQSYLDAAGIEVEPEFIAEVLASPEVSSFIDQYAGEIVDYVGGIDDLKHKKLRILHENSFIDDPTRIIRGLKFAVRFGFDLEENTKRLQDEYLTNVNYDMSFKRLKDELKDAFNLNKQEVLDKFIEQKMYKLLSENINFNNYKCNVENFIKPYRKEIKYIWLVYLAGFDLGNLPLSKKEAKIIENFSEMKNLGGFDLYKKFKNSEIEAVVMYGLIYDFDFTKNYLDNLRKVELNISGKDLIELGYEPSKKVSDVLDEILKQKLKKPNMTKEDEIELAKNYM